ncbi:MAG TPA: alpha/beta fold hydrolase [Vicinamibacterales bacterium]|nr:alpha/beta fold hydrolase [Vicinamibacterales bacterium]
MDQFVPRPALRGGHRMTLFGWGNPRQFPHLPPPTVRYFDPAPRTRVVAHCHWHADPRHRPTILALHGLNGSSHSHYMKGIAAKAFARGMNVVRLNQRNCGDTEHLSEGLFHSGLTEDARHVVEELATVDGLTSIAVAGYSLGGNLALKLAAEYGNTPPAVLIGVAGISPIVEIGECTRALERRENFMYEWNFVRGLKKRMLRKEQHWPGRFDLSQLKAIRSVREFDNVYTAPHFGFADAEDYYFRCSAMRIADRISVPALVITAEDDPFVPPDPFRRPALAANPQVELHVTRHGGHCGFVGPRTGNDDGYWAETRIVEFVARRHASRTGGGPAARSAGALVATC